MKKITHIGLDMDHTLIRYNSANFETLTHKIMTEKLVQLKGYPKKVLELRFSYDYAIRGLVIDKNRGNLLKLSRYGAIRASRHGIHRIDYKTQQQIYRSTYIDLGDAAYDPIDTSFSIAFAALYAQIVDLKDNTPEGKGIPDYYMISEDLLYVLDNSHRDGSIKNIVAQNISDYIVKDETMIQGIQKYRKHGKKFFIVTNSDYKYSKLLLDYAINPFLEKNETWEDIFDYVITSAQKPRFFYDNLKMLKIDPTTGFMTNLETEKISPGIYQGGNASKFTDDLGLDPSEILYVGDHIYGDILRLKKDCSWRTALVVEELGDELKKNSQACPYSDEIESLMQQKIPLEVELDQLISDKIENKVQEHDERIGKLMATVQNIDQKISPLIKKQDKVYNNYWGELMRAGIEESYFAYQVERFACIYMSSLSDLLALSPRTYFRSSKRLMPHDH